MKSLTAEEIRQSVSPMVIWMADATIREARKALTDHTGWPKINRADYNLPEVEMASAILFRMFETFEAAIRQALIEMPHDMDGTSYFCGKNGRKYFDVFVETLAKQLEGCPTPEYVQLRQPDWCLNNL